jgi:hypothetical protein
MMPIRPPGWEHGGTGRGRAAAAFRGRGGGLPPAPAPASPLYRLLERHFRELGLVWDERFAAALGAWRAAEDALGQRSAPLALKAENQAIFKAFETVRPRTRWRRVVRDDVKQFVRAFEKGSRDSERYFSDPSADPALVARWKATPKQDRVFVAGARQDMRLIQGLRAELEKQRKTVFFYTWCAGAAGQLCASATVGAFFGTAGAAVLAVTDASAGSRFAPYEVTAGVRVVAGEPQLFLLTPGEALEDLGAKTGVRTIEAVVEAEQPSQ